LQAAERSGTLAAAMFSRRSAWDPVEEAPLEAGPEVLDLTPTNPTALGIRPPPGLFAALADPGNASYDPDPLGLVVAREAVAAYYAARGASCPIDHLCLLAGTSEGYAHLMALLCDPGDAVLVPQPGYPLLPMIADLAGVELRPYPLVYEGSWSLDLEGLRRALAGAPRARAIVLVAPGNPTGNYLDAGELAAVLDLAAARGLAVIADEVFFDYPLGSVQPATPVLGACPALTFVLSGLSKVAALPQLKLAWVLARGPARAVSEAMRRLALVADAYLTPSTPTQRAAGALLAAAPALQRQILARARANLRALPVACADTALTPLRVQGGWTALIRLPRLPGVDARVWAREAHAAGVLTQPGDLYDLGDHLALSLLTPEAVFGAGLERLTACVAHVIGSAR